MIAKARAFAPANISCIFKIYGHENPRWMGSTGVGFTLNEGVLVETRAARTTKVFFNDKKISLPTVKKVLNTLTQNKIQINIKSPLPLGCGFGLSGAAALATAYALNKLLSLGKSKKQLAIIAHTAEVTCKTGLGDVANQFYGGLLIKFKPSSHFLVEKIPIYNRPVYCKCFGKLATKSIISNPLWQGKINEAATFALNKLKKLLKTEEAIAFGDIIQLSREFAINSGLLKDKKTIETIRNIEKGNGKAAMIMLGKAVFSDTPFSGAMKLQISGRKARVL